MSGKIRKSKEKNGEIVAFSESAMRHNGAVLEYIRTSVSVLVSILIRMIYMHENSWRYIMLVDVKRSADIDDSIVGWHYEGENQQQLSTK